MAKKQSMSKKPGTSGTPAIPAFKEYYDGKARTITVEKKGGFTTVSKEGVDRLTKKFKNVQLAEIYSYVDFLIADTQN